MKARLLKKLLGNTGYYISNHEEYIAVGSPLCHNLISVNKKTLKVKYALDTFNEGRKSLRSNELEFIWDKLHELIENGQIHDIINGKDIIENPLPVFTVTGGKLVESVTDAYGWPNTDDNGILMYNNTHFSSKKPAILYGINEYQFGAQSWNERKKQLKKELQNAINNINKCEGYLLHLNSLLENSDQQNG